MSKKLKIYSTILAIVYIIFFGNSIFSHVYFAIQSGLFGVREHITSLSDYELTGGRMVPAEGVITFPSSIVNEKTGENVRMEIREALIFMKQVPDNIPFYITLLKVISFLSVYVVMGLFIYLPFIAYKVLKSVSKNEFYTLKNINKIKKISFIILLMWAILYLANLFSYLVINFYVQPEGYHMMFDDTNFSILFLGLILLIVSEILRYTTTMKEEQEFTI